MLILIIPTCDHKYPYVVSIQKIVVIEDIRQKTRV